MTAIRTDNWEKLLICLVSKNLEGKPETSMKPVEDLKMSSELKTFNQQRATALIAAPKRLKSHVLVATQPTVALGAIVRRKHRLHQCSDFKFPSHIELI